jgi:hypothetical protein
MCKPYTTIPSQFCVLLIKTTRSISGFIKKMNMKKYLIILSVLTFVACNNSKNTEEQVLENEVRQRTIDSMATVNSTTHHPHANHHSGSTSNSSSSTTNNSVGNDNISTAPAKKKGMSNATKGALIGTGVGIVGGAVTGAATSKDKGKGAVLGGLIGGAVGSGAGYEIGANKDKKDVIK